VKEDIHLVKNQNTENTDREVRENTPSTSKSQNQNQNTNGEVRGRFISKFPETKFYLPTLRDGYTRYIPIG
jgi:hypothetical protein